MEVLGARTPTFEVEGHHYALVVIDGLDDGTEHVYEVHLDGVLRWPLAGSDLPPSTIRTPGPGRPVRVLFGSCRVEVPDRAPHDLGPEESDQGHGVDALLPYALQMAARPFGEWPDHLVMVGDQIYADLGSPVTRARIRAAGGERPGRHGEAADVDTFEEWTWLYQEAWSSPEVRWLLSTVPSAMIFDDHDVINAWNTSMAWLAEAEAEPWWDEHLTGGLMTYWLYQHLGNLAPDDLASDPIYERVTSVDGDAGPVLRRFAADARIRTDRPHPPGRWSFTRDLVGASSARLVMIDSRNSRQLAEGHRSLLDRDDWDWVERNTSGDVDHLLLGTSMPWLLPSGVHDLERCSDVLAAGRWGPPGRWLGEKARRAGTFEHWAAYGHSFEALADLIARVGSGERGAAPASVLVLSGDVHFSYVAPFRSDASGVTSRVVQLVSSPFRNGVPQDLQRALRFANSRAGAVAGRLARRLVASDGGGGAWEVTAGPWFGNGLATLQLDGRSASVRFQQARLDHAGRPDLITVHEETLARPPASAQSSTGPGVAHQ